jgi:hypothetical protein
MAIDLFTLDKSSHAPFKADFSQTISDAGELTKTLK